jgi:16S rRNA (cytosine1402-N4)-methyltransferase
VNNEQRGKMKEEETTYHVPVLLKESVDAMNITPDGTYVDVTFGGGGHSREILSRLGNGGRLLGFDQDEDAERNIVNDPHFTFVRSNFRYLHNFLRYHDIEGVDSILADLGVSSHHFDDSERGFSFRFDGKLDMRMNKRAGITAADVVNTYEEERLADIFYLYGELKNSRKLASVIVKARSGQKIETIGEFLEVVKPLFGREREKKELAKVFQALRIEVNQEMEALKEMLMAATEALKPGGRLLS